MLARRRAIAVSIAVPVALVAATLHAVPAAADSLDTCYPVTGYVRDGMSRPLAGAVASVGTTCSGPNTVTTGADGKYVLYVAGGSLGTTANVAVAKAGYVTRSQSASVKPKVGAKPFLVDMEMRRIEMAQQSRAASYQSLPGQQLTYAEEDLDRSGTDFTLMLAFAPEVTPAALRPGGTVAFSVRVAAPPPGTPGHATAVVATRSYDGVAVPLTPGPYGTDGYTTWTGTTTIPVTEPDGARAVVACAAGPDHTGPCSAAPAGTLLSAVVSKAYTVDATPPVLESADPVPYGTYDRLYSVTARWRDATSGLATVNPFRVLVDGVARPVTVSGTTAYGSLSGVGHGIHTLVLEATDRAGNTARVARIFTIADIGATPARATLHEQTVLVNPSAKVPTPATVRFASPRVDVEGFTEYVSASTWVGHGQVRRPVSFTTVEVEFVNETYIPKVVTTTLPTAYATHDLALLTPSASTAVATVPASALTLADVNVAVPTGYGTPGSQATLRSVVTWLGEPQSTNAQLGATRFAGRVAIAGSIASCASTEPDTADCDNGEVKVNGNPAAIAPGPRPDESPLKDAALCEDAPGVASGEGCLAQERLEEARARAAFGCAEQADLNFGFAQRRVNLCDIQAEALAAGDTTAAPERPFASAFLNGWVYGARDGARTLYPDLQQSRVEAAEEGGACPNGESGSVSSWVYRAAANVLATDGATAPEHAGTWRPPVAQRMLPPIQRVRLGREQGPYLTADGVAESTLREDRSYQLTSVDVQPEWSDEGDYHLVSGAVVDAFGTRVPVDGATSSLWEYRGDRNAPASGLGGVVGSVDLVNATTFAQSPLPGYQRLFSLDFQVVADFTGCG